MSDTSTEAVERMAQNYDAANESLPDPRRNLTSTTLRAIAAERDALRAENERLRKVLSFADHIHRTVTNWQKYGNTTHSSIQACLNAYEKSRDKPSSDP